MDTQKVDLFLAVNGKFFEAHQIPAIREQLLRLDESKVAVAQAISFKDPTMILIVSLLAGSFGIDRFMVGDVGLGVAKLLTCGGFGVWAIVDWFLIMGVTRQKNYELLQQTLAY